METIRIKFNVPLSASQKIVGISSYACYNSSNELVEFVISESTITDDGKSIDITFFNSRLVTQDLDHIDLNFIVVKPSSGGGGGSVDPATTTEPGIVQLTAASGSDIYSNPSQYDAADGNPVVLNATQTKAMIVAGTAGSVTPAQLNLKQDKTLSSPLQIDSGNSVTTVETGLSGLRNKIRSTVLFADAPSAGFNIQANANTGDRYCKILDYNGAMNNAVSFLIEGRLAVTKANSTISDTHLIKANILVQTNNIHIESELASPIPDNFDILISTTGGVFIKVFKGIYDSVMFIGFAAGTFRNYNANNYMTSLPAGTVIAKSLSTSAIHTDALQPKALATPLEIIDSTEYTVEGALSTLADITNNAILAQPTRVMLRNVSSDVLYYKIGTLDEMDNPLGNFSGVILNDNIIPKFDITFNKINNLIKFNGYYYGELPANTDIIITENHVYLKLPPNFGFLFISEFFVPDNMSLVISSATSSLSEEIQASLSVDAIKLTKGGGTNTGYNLISTLTINADPSS